MTRHRWIEVARIVLVAVLVLSYQQRWVPVGALWATVAVGLYPLTKTGVRDLIVEHKIGTEIFVTLATITALIGGEATAGAVLMVIILFAEFIADLNTDRARASIKGLIGSVPRTALLRDATGEHVVDIDEVRPGDVVLVRAGDQIPVDGTVTSGTGAVDESSITGEPTPKDKQEHATVFAGTMLDSGALDVRTERAGNDTTFARIVSLVEQAEASQAPIQRLSDRVAAWLIPVVIVFLAVVFIVTGDVRKVVTLMIFTSPAELGLATPMVMIAAIARAARGASWSRAAYISRPLPASTQSCSTKLAHSPSANPESTESTLSTPPSPPTTLSAMPRPRIDAPPTRSPKPSCNTRFTQASRSTNRPLSTPSPAKASPLRSTVGPCSSGTPVS